MRNLFAVLLLGTAIALPATAEAQSAIEGRVDRLEREMRAVQRKVFPGTQGSQYFEPEITGAAPVTTAPGLPSSSAVTDLTTRVDALEKQQRTLTGQIEQAQYRLQQLEEAFASYKRATDARLTPLENGAAPPAAGMVDPPATVPTRPTPAKPAPAKPDSAATKPAADPARAARLAAIDKPKTADAIEDDYIYVYRLWDAKLYPEAETAAKAFVTKNPKHRRASYAQNLLGRSYLDDGKPSLAVLALYENYQKNPDGERAPDSLYYLAQALMKLNKPGEACKVYLEFNDVYGSKASADLKAKVAAGRTAAQCK